jgi:hypothetical protein
MFITDRHAGYHLRTLLRTLLRTICTHNSDHIFSFMESTDENGQIDFGDFVRVLCTYCLFGKSELMTYAYTVNDTTNKGISATAAMTSYIQSVYSVQLNCQRAVFWCQLYTVALLLKQCLCSNCMHIEFTSTQRYASLLILLAASMSRFTKVCILSPICSVCYVPYANAHALHRLCDV